MVRNAGSSGEKVGGSDMAEINFHPDDKVMSGPEVAKNGGYFVVGLLIFEFMFYAMYLELSLIHI